MVLGTTLLEAPAYSLTLSLPMKTPSYSLLLPSSHRPTP